MQGCYFLLAPRGADAAFDAGESTADVDLEIIGNVWLSVPARWWHLRAWWHFLRRLPRTR